MSKQRQYRFTSLDATGWLFGLSGEQCITLSLGILFSGIALDSHMTPVITAAPIALAFVIAFTRIESMTLLAATNINARLLFARLFRRNAWQKTELPPFMRHLEWSTTDNNIGVVVDRQAHTVSATVRITARRFVLDEPDTQVVALDHWGDVLATFATEKGRIARISWCESTTRSNLRPDVQTRAASSAIRSYLELISKEQEHGDLHQTTVTMSVDTRRVRVKARSDELLTVAATSALRDELHLFCAQIRNAGLHVDTPLTTDELKHLVKERVSPWTDQTERHITLGNATRRLPERIDLSNGTVLRDHVQIGNTFHRTYWIRQWPRMDVGPSWLEPLLFHPDISRSISVHLEPISPSASRRQATRTATKLETDAAQRSRAGFRIGDMHHRATQAVIDREVELGSGFAEFAYIGLVSISASDLSSLERSCLELSQTASACGIEIRPLHGQHAAGLLCTLPIGQAPDRKRISS